jgi:peptidoglycan-N-acetylglucosamine deacetylase
MIPGNQVARRTLTACVTIARRKLASWINEDGLTMLASLIAAEHAKNGGRTVLRDTRPATATEAVSTAVRQDKPGGTGLPVLRLAVPVAAVAAAGAAALAVARAGPGITGIGPVRRLLFPRLAGQGDPTHIALTFDDGPDPESTPMFAAVLADRGIRATFFMLGRMVAAAPELAGNLAAAGHEIGVHGWDHRYLPLRGLRETRTDLRRATDLIASVTGKRPTLFRPPYGVLSGPALVAARELGLTPLLWGAWGREWTAGSTPESVFQTLAGDLDGGVTVLLHDSGCTSPPGSWQAGLGALSLLLDACEQRGLRVGPVAEHGIPGLEWRR